MANKQRFKPPQPGRKYPASEFNRAMEVLAGLSGMTGDESINVTWVGNVPIVSVAGTGPDKFAWVKIVGAQAIPSTTNRWEYTGILQRVMKVGVFEDIPGAEPPPKLYNSLEWDNGASGIQGNGQDPTTMPSGSVFEQVPATGKVVVLCRKEVNCDGDHEWYFQYSNQTKVQCDTIPPPP